MASEWQELTRLTQGSPLTVERVRLGGRDLAIEGSFELPPLARLIQEDQIFVTAFLRCHGSIKDMEGLFGISYPTVKNRLKRIAAQLEYVEINPPPSALELLQRLEQGEIDVGETLKKLEKRP
ncbi:MAG: DUF2089 domain-containing protein [Candidatus Aminicenantes bacterium]|nr:DUF2089 domain-containing protein [Acidobacteriota bacterium]MCG2811837.1 DUF2089 domain-containing protein [Candidatus Aminicenantes bacterium]